MWVSSIQVVDYKCFADTGVIELSPGFNVVVGRNNAGKSSLLEALNFAHDLADNRHRSPAAQRFDPAKRHSALKFTLSIPQAELKEMLLKSPGDLHIPLPEERATDGSQVIEDYFSRSEFQFTFTKRPGAFESPAFPSVSGSNWTYKRSLRLTRDALSRNIVVHESQNTDQNDNVPALALSQFRPRTFAFHAERLRIGSSNPEDTDLLSPNANNLPAVLLNLQSDAAAFSEYVTAVRRVIPGIGQIGVKWENGAHVILVWPDYAPTGKDNALRLETCGSGLAQAMAILYVVLRMESGLVVIDEPNSFLHPGATKELLSIMRQNPRNQYIISTHSADVIATTQPARLLRVYRQGTESKVAIESSGDIAAVRDALAELGTSLSDVFGLEKVVWVEGPTEQDCFRLLLEADGKGVPPGIAFAPMRTSEIARSKRADVIADLHHRVATASAIVPTAIAYSFDGENYTKPEKERINKSVGCKAQFLPRRMYENYLFHPLAIERALKAASPTTEVTADQAADWLVANEGFERVGPATVTHATVEKIDGAKALKTLFQALGTTEYRKTRDSVRVTQEILAAEPEFLYEVTAYVRSLVEGGE